MSTVGLGGSDLRVIRGEWPRPTPMVLGYEGAGMVEAVGTGVSQITAGQPVVLSWASPHRHGVKGAEAPHGLVRAGLAGREAYEFQNELVADQDAPGADLGVEPFGAFGELPVARPGPDGGADESRQGLSDTINPALRRASLRAEAWTPRPRRRLDAGG